MPNLESDWSRILVSIVQDGDRGERTVTKNEPLQAEYSIWPQTTVVITDESGTPKAELGCWRLRKHLRVLRAAA